MRHDSAPRRTDATTTRFRKLSYALCLALTCWVNVRGDVTPLPLMRSDLSGAWFGVRSKQDHAYRVVLDSAGTGTLAYCYRTNAPHTYQITNWGISAGTIHITAIPTHPDDETIAFKAEVDTRGLRLTITAKRWTDALVIQREADLESALTRLRAASQSKQEAAPRDSRNY
jgi:hypothetical protein